VVWRSVLPFCCVGMSVCCVPVCVCVSAHLSVVCVCVSVYVMYDCVEGILRIMRGNYGMPLNLGTDEMVTLDQLVDIIKSIAKKKILKRYDSAKPQGVRGRNSDNTLIGEVLGWTPTIPLKDGMAHTYPWIEQRLAK